MTRQGRLPLKLSVSVAIGLLLFGCGSPATQTPTGEQSAQVQTVRIGFPAPVTGPGAEIGDFAVKAARLAVEEINARGSAGNYQLELYIEDGECEPRKASAATERLISVEKVHALLGAVCSSATMAATDVAQENSVPMVVPISSADGITQRGYDHVFRVTPSNSDIASVFAKYIVENVNPTSIAFVFEQTDWGRNAAEQFRDYLESGGVTTVSFDGVSREVQNFLPILTKLKGANPDATMVIMLAPQGQQFLDQAAEIGFQTQWLGLQTIAGTEFLDKVGNKADGLLAHSLFEVRPDDLLGNQFVEAFTEKYGHPPDHYAALVYDGVNVLAAAISQAGPDPAAIRNALAGVEDVPGVTGSTTFGDDGQAYRPGFVVQWKDHQRAIVSP